MKFNALDLTIIIPVRIDSVVRLENIISVVSYLRHNLNTNIMILEASYYNNRILKKLLTSDVEYYFIEDKDPIFYRTHYLNYMAEKVQTEYLAIWDTDVIVPQNQIIDSIMHLRNGSADVAYPYDGNFLDTTKIIRYLYINSNNINVLNINKKKMIQIYGNQKMKGGAIIINSHKYKMAGMENENFYGWGPEDLERYACWKTLGYSIYMSTGCLFHLTHPRDYNGTFNSTYQELFLKLELDTIQYCSKDEIIKYRKRPHINHI